MLIKVFTYLDRWSRAHNFEGNNGKKMDPVYLIFVVDGRIDPCKKSRNNKHEMKKKKLAALGRKIRQQSAPDADDLQR